jgi:hypothetical protein
MQPCFQQTFMIPGTQAADHVFEFAAPFGMTLVHVSMSNSSANAGTLDLGEAADADGWADGKTMGVSNAITELDAYSEFDGATAGGQYPHLDDGDVCHVTIKDHGSHMANAIVLLTWMPD